MTEADARKSGEAHEPYSHEHLLVKWRAIRDGCADWVADCIAERQTKGSACAVDIYLKAVAEIDRIESRVGATTERSNAIIIAGFDPKSLETEPPTVAEA